MRVWLQQSLRYIRKLQSLLQWIPKCRTNRWSSDEVWSKGERRVVCRQLDPHLIPSCAAPGEEPCAPRAPARPAWQWLWRRRSPRSRTPLHFLLLPLRALSHSLLPPNATPERSAASLLWPAPPARLRRCGPCPGRLSNFSSFISPCASCLAAAAWCGARAQVRLDASLLHPRSAAPPPRFDVAAWCGARAQRRLPERCLPRAHRRPTAPERG